MAKKYLFLILIPLLFFSSGCWDLREINASAIPVTVGFDLSDNNKIDFSTLFAQPASPGQGGGNQMKTVLSSSSGESVALAARRMMLSLSRIPDWTHVQTIVLGENLCRNDLPMTIDFMNRNRNIRPDTNLIISAGTNPKELLFLITSLGDGFKQLLLVNEFQIGTYVPTTMGEFTYKLMTPGIEPVVPQIIIVEDPIANKPAGEGDKNAQSTDNNKKLLLQGTAVFKGDKMIGSLDEIESRGYRWLNSASKTGGFMLVKSPLNAREYVALEVIRFSSKTSSRFSEDNLKMHLEISAQLSFYEEAGSGELLTPGMIKKLEQAANLEIARQIQSCIHKSQRLNSDILGWGLTVQEYQPNEWKRLASDWNERYPFIEADVSVKTSITQTYLSNKSFNFQ